MLINLLVLYLFLMEFKTKYTLVKNLCELIWNSSKNDQVSESNPDLIFYDTELVSKVRDGFKRWKSDGIKESVATIEETLESKRNYVVEYVLNDLFRRNSNRINFLIDFYHLDGIYDEKRDIPKENLDYITALIIFYHITHERNIILSNTSLDYCETLAEELLKEYPEHFEVEKIPRKNLEQCRKLIFDPLKRLDDKEGIVLDLGKFKCFKEELPDSIKQMGL